MQIEYQITHITIRFAGTLETTSHMFDSLAGRIRGDISGVIAWCRRWRERTRQIFCMLRAKRRACVRIMSRHARSLSLSSSRRTATPWPRGRMEKYESFLRAINASAYSQGRPRARCCIHLSDGAVAVSPSRYVRNNFVKPGEPDRACKKGVRKTHPSTEVKERLVLEEPSRDTRVYHAMA